MNRYFLYLLVGGKGIRNLKGAAFPSNIKVLDCVTLDKHGERARLVSTKNKGLTSASEHTLARYHNNGD